jgi:hypothetical protein
MSFTQLNPSLAVSVEGKGNGFAFAVITMAKSTT